MFVLDLVRNPEDRLSHNEAHICLHFARNASEELEDLELVILVWFDALRLGKQFLIFQSCWDGATASWVILVLFGGKYVLLKDTTRRPEWG